MEIYNEKMATMRRKTAKIQCLLSFILSFFSGSSGSSSFGAHVFSLVAVSVDGDDDPAAPQLNICRVSGVTAHW